MPYTLHWYIDQEIVYVHFSGKILPEDMRMCLLEVNERIAASPRHLVHAIIDVGDITIPVPPMESLKIVREIPPHERAGWNITLREHSTLMKIGIAFGTSLLKTRARAFETLAEVDTFLKDVDSTLSWERANKAVIAPTE